MENNSHNVDERRAARMRGAERYKIQNVEFSLDQNLLANLESSTSSSTRSSPASNQQNLEIVSQSEAYHKISDLDDSTSIFSISDQENILERRISEEVVRENSVSSIENVSSSAVARETQSSANILVKDNHFSSHKQKKIQRGSIPFHKRDNIETSDAYSSSILENSPPNKVQRLSSLDSSQDLFQEEHPGNVTGTTFSSQAPEERIASPISTSSPESLTNQSSSLQSSLQTSSMAPRNLLDQSTEKDIVVGASDELVRIELTKLSKEAGGSKTLNELDAVQQFFQEFIKENEPLEPYLVKVKNAFVEQVSIRLLELIDLLDANRILSTACKKAANEKLAVQRDLSKLREDRLSVQRKKIQLRNEYIKLSHQQNFLDDIDDFFSQCETVKNELENVTTTPNSTEAFSEINEYASALSKNYGLESQLVELQSLLTQFYQKFLS